MTACCANCGDEMIRPRKDKDIHFCTKPKCRAALAHHIYKKSYKPIPPNKKCSNCGKPIKSHGRVLLVPEGYHFCSNSECQKARIILMRETKKNRLTLPPKERSIYRAFVFPDKTKSYSACTKCRFRTHCQKRVQYGLWVCCESADKRDKERLAVSPHIAQIQYLLVEGMTL